MFGWMDGCLCKKENRCPCKEGRILWGEWTQGEAIGIVSLGIQEEEGGRVYLIQGLLEFCNC